MVSRVKYDLSICLWAFERLHLEVFLRKATQKDQRLLALALSGEAESTKQRVQKSMSRNAFRALTEDMEIASKKASPEQVDQAKEDILALAKQLSKENNSGVRWPLTVAKEAVLADEVTGKDESGYLRRVLEGAIFALKGNEFVLLMQEWMKDPMFLSAALSLPRESRQIVYKEASYRYKEEIGHSLAEGYLVVMRPTEALIARKALVFRLRECRKNGVIQLAADSALVKKGAGLKWSHYQKMLQFEEEMGRLNADQLTELFLNFSLSQGVLAIYEIESAVRERVYQKIGEFGAGVLRYKRDDIDMNELVDEADKVRTAMLAYAKRFA